MSDQCEGILGKAEPRDVRNCFLFYDLDAEKTRRALQIFSAEKFCAKKGTTLHFFGETLSYFGYLIKGVVEVYTEDYDGRSMLMAHVTPGATFGEALCYLQKRADVRIVAAQDSTMIRLHMDWMRGKHESPQSLEEQELRRLLFQRFGAMLSIRTLNMNNRIQILSKPSIRMKLTTYFSFCVQEYGKKTFRIPMSREKLALYLGCDRSALSRELSRMKNEGLLEYNRNQFIIF